MKSLRRNRSGLIYVWVVCFFAIVIYSIAWFVLGWSAMMTIQAVEDAYTFTGPAATTVDLVKTVIAWHPLIFIFGMIIWALVNSHKREYVSYQEG